MLTGRDAGGGAVRGGHDAGPRHARLFVAADLPRPVRGVMARWAAEHRRGLAGLRLIDERYLHVTLCFLGWRDEDEVGEIARTCRSAAEAAEAAEAAGREATGREQAVALSVSGALWLPPRRPRVLTVELRDESGLLAAIQSSLAQALERAGFYEPEDRPFLAHVTVARVQRGARVRPDPLPAPDVRPFAAEAVTLYRSRLQRSGARYEAVERIPLGAGDPPDSLP